MPSALPDGEPVPTDGSLPASAFDGAQDRELGFYLHVPFCTVRCGYCDFNTYTAPELGDVTGASIASYADAAVAEVELARRVMEQDTRKVSTVFFGGGTPTLLPPEDLVRMLQSVRDRFGFADDVEVTTEANPDSVTPESLAILREGGFTRLSFGMQSAVPHVLATLDRTHNPARVPQAVTWAREAGFEQVSLDLIYGTPGESHDDWRLSLDSALESEPDHVSAYALIVEDGTALARRVRRGEIAMPDDDDLAEKYEIADARLTAAGLRWYEVSNWSRDEASECRHNVLYWTGADWWGIGPGAHSHVGGTRFWNVKHPAAYGRRLAAGETPAAGREVLSAHDQYVERVLLEVRLARGVALRDLDVYAVGRIPALQADGLVEVRAARLVLTDRGRLLADAVVRDLLQD